MVKYIRLEMSNGYVWSIKAEHVAEHRAKYYAEVDKDTTYQEEYDFAMSDDYELLDWMQNNTNPSDFKGKLFISLRPDEPEEPYYEDADFDVEEVDGELVEAQ